jgi:hypothetical protein
MFAVVDPISGIAKLINLTCRSLRDPSSLDDTSELPVEKVAVNKLD